MIDSDSIDGMRRSLDDLVPYVELTEGRAG